MRILTLVLLLFLTLQAIGPTAPDADEFQYHGPYVETDDAGSALITFGLGHLFNYDKVVAEYRSYFRPDGPRSSKYKYKFDYAESINKQ